MEKANPNSVVRPKLCSSYPVQLTIKRKIMSITDGNFRVSDAEGNIIFKVKDILFSFRDKRVLLDSAGNPLLTLQRKILSAHNTWRVYKGESSHYKDLVFSVRTSSVFQLKTKLEVFFLGNTTKDRCDCSIKGSWFERSCVIYQGRSSVVVAQMQKKYNVHSVLLGKDTFIVNLRPNVDQAFIVALTVILNEINQDGV